LEVRSLLEKLRIPALVVLAAAAPLGAWLGPCFHVSGTKTSIFLGAFDLVLWPALVLVLALRLWTDGPLGVLRAIRRAPLAGWWLLAVAAWSGLAWPRIAGGEPLSLAGVAKELIQITEYGLVGLVVAAELVRDEDRARRAVLGTLAAACGIVLAVGAVQYFTGTATRSDFGVGALFGNHNLDGEFLPNRNAFGAFLAVLVPFAAAVALGRSGCCCWWNGVWGILAAAGTLLALSGGAVLGIVCGTLAGAAVLGRRKLALAVLGLLALLAVGQMLPRRNLSKAFDSVSFVRVNPHKTEEEKVLALRYLRYASELTVLSKGLSGKEGSGKLFFGLGPGGYDREKNYRPVLDDRFQVAGQTDVPENYDVLANEPHSFDLWLGQGAQLGVLGLAGFLWLFAWWGAAALRAWRRASGDDPMRAVAAGAFAAVIGAAVAGVFTSPWIQGVGPLLVVLVATVLPAPGKRRAGPGVSAGTSGGGSGPVVEAVRIS
jgi:hypothetical protein